MISSTVSQKCALEDFDKLPKTISKTEKSKNDSTKKEGDEAGEAWTDETWSQDFLKDTADKLEKNLQNLMKNGGGEDDALQKMAQTVANSITGGGSGSGSENDSDTNDFQAAIARALKGISATNENLQNAGPEMTEADLAAMFGQASIDEGPDGLFPFMQGMMQSLFSKEVLYPSLKELSDKYPAWLEEKKSTLSPEDLARYTKQLDLIQKVCLELEKEKEDDTEDIKKKRFDVILALMQDMQSCGQPPEDLVGDQVISPFDGEGAPAMPALPPGLDQQNCSIM
ncbi:peroxisomal biogenesis factor 19 isoform X2 [Aphidius gifuensis]|uniref:peroxisomal biogenesis factor 19 isoform X2 n=1 Tax=Aphidius gifuensis TaxID=684658 RepID=UPI001CDC8D88|nr:peroxisomal biogenesis factor 19 isoform X2 [Aphidius gifuensis]